MALTLWRVVWSIDELEAVDGGVVEVVLGVVGVVVVVVAGVVNEAMIFFCAFSSFVGVLSVEEY
jgi:hypothetical protein